MPLNYMTWMASRAASEAPAPTTRRQGDAPKHCDLTAILARASSASRTVDVQDSPAVTIAADDAYSIGDVTRTDVPAMVDEIAALRGGLSLALTLLEGGALKSDVRNLYALLPPDEKETDDAV